MSRSDPVAVAVRQIKQVPEAFLWNICLSS